MMLSLGESPARSPMTQLHKYAPHRKPFLFELWLNYSSGNSPGARNGGRAEIKHRNKKRSINNQQEREPTIFKFRGRRREEEGKATEPKVEAKNREISYTQYLKNSSMIAPKILRKINLLHPCRVLVPVALEKRTQTLAKKIIPMQIQREIHYNLRLCANPRQNCSMKTSSVIEKLGEKGNFW